jgi:hypothetical protein
MIVWLQVIAQCANCWADRLWEPRVAHVSVGGRHKLVGPHVAGRGHSTTRFKSHTERRQRRNDVITKRSQKDSRRLSTKENNLKWVLLCCKCPGRRPAACEHRCRTGTYKPESAHEGRYTRARLSNAHTTHTHNAQTHTHTNTLLLTHTCTHSCNIYVSMYYYYY